MKELQEGLQSFLGGTAHDRVSHGGVPEGRSRKLGFVFPGHGGQWRAMGKELLAAEPLFASLIAECDRLLRRWCDWSLVSVLRGEVADLERADVVQPAVFAVQVGLAELLRSFGVLPDAVLGHSMGEVAAAYVAKVLSLEDACLLIGKRSQLVMRYSGMGGMAAVELPAEEVLRAIAPYGGRLCLAAVNGPRSTAISGEREALKELSERLRQQGVLARLLKVDYASHSPQMDALGPEFMRALSGLRAARARLPWYSTVTGKKQDGEVAAEYWQRNLREPVQLLAALRALAEDG